MPLDNLEATTQALVANGKGILAADETIATLTRRFEQLKIPSTPDTRREYRELLFTTSGSSKYISGAIMYDETIRQQASNGKQLLAVLRNQGIVPGIKVDTGAKPLAGSRQETITEGLDGLRERLKEYRMLGAQFAKWRAVIRIADQLPSDNCIIANAHALGRYAALCQEQGLVPIVEPEVLMDGAHTIERCEEVTGKVLNSVFNEMYDQGVLLEAMLLKPNMVLSGSLNRKQASVSQVADATLRCLLRHVPVAVPGVVFLSGGQSDALATAHLNAINQKSANKPWKISFSYGRALQDPALATWLGDKENCTTAQRAYYHRAKCNAAASLGGYTAEMENECTNDSPTQYQSERQDD